MNSKQINTPLVDALEAHVNDEVVSFHVPAHKKGSGLDRLEKLWGSRIFDYDLNAMEGIDDLSNPVSVIAEAQRLAAELFSADHAFFMVNGATSGMHAMILSAVHPGDEIIVPRNSHKSLFSALVLSGATPVYTYPQMNFNLNTAGNITVEELNAKVEKHPHARAVLLNHPTYYGISADIRPMIETAHRHEMAVLADEAHGTHFYFHDYFTAGAMTLGADLSTVSMHKTGGSLTQTAMLLHSGSLISESEVTDILNITRSTSSSYLLMASLDAARQNLAVNGNRLLDKTIRLSEYAREHINRLPGFKVYDRSQFKDPRQRKFFDDTRLIIEVSGTGLSGFEVEQILRKEYRVQIELSDINHILALNALGNSEDDIERLVSALQSISRLNYTDKQLKIEPVPEPEMIVPPRAAHYSPVKRVALEQAVNEIAAEMLMAYPPGVPIFVQGEKISRESIEYIRLLRNSGCSFQGPSDLTLKTIRVLGPGH